MVQGGFHLKIPYLHTVYFEQVNSLYFIPVTSLPFRECYIVGFFMLSSYIYVLYTISLFTFLTISIYLWMNVCVGQVCYGTQAGFELVILLPQSP
jgi:hypothetical protein